MSALVNVLTILDNYALKQTSKKHQNRDIKYSKTRGLEDSNNGRSGGCSVEGHAQPIFPRTSPSKSEKVCDPDVPISKCFSNSTKHVHCLGISVQCFRRSHSYRRSSTHGQCLDQPKTPELFQSGLIIAPFWPADWSVVVWVGSRIVLLHLSFSWK